MMVTPESSVNSNNGSKPKPRVRSERKKLQDRLAQRATREKTKGRIALLEQTLSSLRADDKQSEIASLIRTIDSLQNKNNRLQSAINKIRNALDPLTLAGDDDYNFKIEIKPCGCSLDSACSCSLRSTPLATKTELVAVSPPQNLAETVHPPSGVTLTTIDQTEEEDDFLDETGAGSVKTDQDENMAGFCHLDNLDFDLNTVLDVLDHTDFHSWNGHTPSPFDIWSIPLGPAGRIAPDMEKWHVSNRAYSSALNARKQVKSATMLDLQVPFKAAIWGWESVGPEAEHPVWDALRQVDQRVFGIWTSKAQRIAMMYVCQTLIQYRENPTPENLAQVPGFLQPRPAQERFEHPVVIDFLIWPSVRDRLVFEHERYTATGHFSAAYVENFNFFWPYSDQEIFSYEPSQNRFEVSKVFLEYVNNFKNWTMESPFFDKFPEMRYDIPAFEGPVSVPQAKMVV